MTTPFLSYGRQSISEEDSAAVAQALLSDRITRGEKTEEFEKAIADYCGASYAVALNSGSAALAAAAYAVGVEPGDELLTTPNTFVSTAGTFLQRGATAVFADIDPSTGNIHLEQLIKALNYPLSRSKRVVLPVHFAGTPVDMRAIDANISLPSTCVIEDAAHALGSYYPSGEKVGSCAYSQCTIFSFHPVKNITTGEGGMVTTNDPELAHRLRLFRDNGIERNPLPSSPKERGFYDVFDYTNNFHMTDFQAALGISQLGRLESFIEKRRKLVRYYRKLLEKVPHLRLLSDQQEEKTAFHLFVVQIDFAAIGKTRQEIMELLFERGIGTQVHYIPLYRHTAFRREHCDLIPYFPHTEAYYASALTLPLFFDMRESDVERVVEELCNIL